MEERWSTPASTSSAGSKRKASKPPSVECISTSLQSLTEHLTAKEPKKMYDKYDHFAASLAKQIREMDSPYLRSLAKMKAQEAVHNVAFGSQSTLQQYHPSPQEYSLPTQQYHPTHQPYNPPLQQYNFSQPQQYPHPSAQQSLAPPSTSTYQELTPAAKQTTPRFTVPDVTD